MNDLHNMLCCPTHRKAYVLIEDTNQNIRFFYCDACDNETKDSNALLERTFLDLVRKEYFLLVIFPFVYSSLSLLIDIGEIWGFVVQDSLVYKVILTVVISNLLSFYLIKTRRKTLKPLISLSTNMPQDIDIKKSQVE